MTLVLINGDDLERVFDQLDAVDNAADAIRSIEPMSGEPGDLPMAIVDLRCAIDDIREPSLAATFPALTRWARTVIAGPTGRRALEIAAAWEVTALEAELSGEYTLAAQAKARAHQTMLHRRRSA